MLTLEQETLLRTNLFIDNHGYIVVRDDTVASIDQIPGNSYAIQIGEQRFTVTIRELRHVLITGQSQVVVIGDSTYSTDPNYSQDSSGFLLRWRKKYPGCFFTVLLGVLLLMNLIGMAFWVFNNTPLVQCAMGDIYGIRGLIYHAMGEYSKAEAAFTRAIESNPQSYRLHNNRGIMYYVVEEYEKAEADYTRAIELNPEYAKAYNNRGLVYSSIGEYEKAEVDYNRVVELWPDSPKVYTNRGLNYYGMGEYAKAEADCIRALELDSEYMKAYCLQGMLYNTMGKYAEAEVAYNKAIELDPDSPVAYAYRGLNYYAMGEHSKAEADYSKAIELNPEYGEAYYHRGSNYNAMGKYDLAVADFEYAVTLMSSPNVYYQGAIAYAQSGHIEEACIWLENAFQEMPQWREQCLLVDPNFNPIRQAECFQSLMSE